MNPVHGSTCPSLEEQLDVMNGPIPGRCFLPGIMQLLKWRRPLQVALDLTQ
jgi:hypothetical protein